MVCENIPILFFHMSCTVFSAPFIGDTVFSTSCIFYFIVEDQLTLKCVGLFFGSLYCSIHLWVCFHIGFIWFSLLQLCSVVQNLTAIEGDTKDTRLLPGSGRSPGEGNVNPLQYSSLGYPMDRGAHGVAELNTTEYRNTHTHTVQFEVNDCGTPSFVLCCLYCLGSSESFLVLYKFKNYLFQFCEKYHEYFPQGLH